MRLRSPHLWRAVPLALTLSLIMPEESARSRPEAGNARAPEQHFTHNRFGRFASAVWRYREPFARRHLTAVPNNNPEP